MTQVTRKIIYGCDGGPCPAIADTTDPETAAIQGAKTALTDLGPVLTVPDHEDVILVPKWLLRRWAIDWLLHLFVPARIRGWWVRRPR